MNDQNFFRVALTGPFKEAYAKTVTLPEDSSTIFAFFVHWLKHGRFPDKNLDNDKFLIQLWKGPRTPACEFGHPDYLVRLYLFGDKYDIKILRNECILALISNLQRGKEPAWPSHLVINHAYKLLPPKSSLCRLLVEMICRCADEEYDFEKFESAPLLRAVCHGLTELKFENDVRRQVRYIDMNDFLEDW